MAMSVSASQPLLLTPPGVLVPGPSSALVILSVALLLHFPSQWHSPGSHPVSAPPAVPDPSSDSARSISQTCQLSRGRLQLWGP